MMNRIAALVLGGTLAAVAGCTGNTLNSQDSQAPALAEPSLPAPGRAQLPCTYPDDIASLDALRGSSRAVVLATVDNRTGTASTDDQATQVAWSLTTREVIESRTAVPQHFQIAITTSALDQFFRDDEYVLFLYADSVDSRGTKSFAVLNGVEGMLPVRNSKLFRECYGVGTDRRQAGGKYVGESVDNFASRMKARPQPKPDPRDPAATATP